MTIRPGVPNHPLRLLVAVVFLLIYIPGLGLLLIHVVIDGGAQIRLDQQRQLVQELDQSINYDNRITKVTRKVVNETRDQIEQVFFDKDGYLFARDLSIRISDTRFELRSRTYYDKFGTVIARDVYEPGSTIPDSGIYKPDVVKRREYFSQNQEMLLCEYFDKSGVPILLPDSKDICRISGITILSPFPPLFNFYR